MWIVEPKMLKLKTNESRCENLQQLSQTHAILWVCFGIHFWHARVASSSKQTAAKWASCDELSEGWEGGSLYISNFHHQREISLHSQVPDLESKWKGVLEMKESERERSSTIKLWFESWRRSFCLSSTRIEHTTRRKHNGTSVEWREEKVDLCNRRGNFPFISRSIRYVRNLRRRLQNIHHSQLAWAFSRQIETVNFSLSSSLWSEISLNRISSFPSPIVRCGISRRPPPINYGYLKTGKQNFSISAKLSLGFFFVNSYFII